MKVILEIPDEEVEIIKRNGFNKDGTFSFKLNEVVKQAIRNGIVLPKGHFIAICESDYPITEKVENTLKETAFVGGDEEEEDMYCFDIKEIIKADMEEE